MHKWNQHLKKKIQGTQTLQIKQVKNGSETSIVIFGKNWPQLLEKIVRGGGEWLFSR